MSDTLILGQCANRACALHKIHSWAKKKHKSYTLNKVERHEADERKHYFRVTVDYHTHSKGKYALGDFSYTENLMKRVRFENKVMSKKKKGGNDVPQ